MSAVAQRLDTTPTEIFKWRDSHGKYRRVDQMVTRHLFFTLRMIWNHPMPEEARSPFYNHYRFPAIYTAEYMKDAIRFICRELFTRTDLEPDWKFELMRFASYLNKTKYLETQS